MIFSKGAATVRAFRVFDAETCAENPKSQAPSSKEIPNSKLQESKRAVPVLEFGAWSFFGIWSLGFGTSARGAVSRLRVSPPGPD
jgi:hypothetical protein